jgi:hypothetical protein
MKVSEIKALAPLAEVYEIKSDAKYIITVDPREDIKHVLDCLREFGGLRGIVIVARQEIKFHEIQENNLAGN